MPRKIFVTAHYNPKVNACRRMTADKLNKNGDCNEIVFSENLGYTYEEAEKLRKILHDGEEVAIIVDSLAKADQKLIFEKILSTKISKHFVPSFWPYQIKDAIFRGFYEAFNYFFDRLILLGVENGGEKIAIHRMKTFYPQLEKFTKYFSKYR